MGALAEGDRDGADPIPIVTVVVVNYNGERHIEQCLESLRADGVSRKRILVVDNASTDGSRSVLERIDSPDIEVVFSERNLGYAGAINRALDRARSQYLAALNMDVVVERGWLGPLLGFLEENESVAAVNPLILLKDSDRVNAAGQRLHVTGLGFNRFLGELPSRVGRTPFRIAGIHGAAFVARTEVLRSIGGLDESGFLYHEDVNLSWLLRLTGFDLFCVPEAIVRHDYFLTMYPEKFFLLERNRLMLVFSALRPATMVGLLPALGISEALSWAYALVRGPAFLRAKAKSYRSLVESREAMRARRAWVQRERTVGDWELLGKLGVFYDFSQMRTLLFERSASRREPTGGLPTKGA